MENNKKVDFKFVNIDSLLFSKICNELDLALMLIKSCLQDRVQVCELAIFLSIYFS